MAQDHIKNVLQDFIPLFALFFSVHFVFTHGASVVEIKLSFWLLWSYRYRKKRRFLLACIKELDNTVNLGFVS